MSLYEQSRDRNWQNRFSKPVEAVPRDAGLGINKPSHQNNMGATNPKPEPKKQPHEDVEFYRHWQEAQGSDPTFKRMNDEMMKLTAALREDVKRGEMPRQLAEKRIREAMEDQRFNADLDRRKFSEMMEAEGGNNGNA